MLLVVLACVLSGAVLALPLIRATRRAEAARALIRPGDYLRTRRSRSRIRRVRASSFGLHW